MSEAHSVGDVVFLQRSIEHRHRAQQLKKLFDKMGYTGDTVDDIMKILDSNKDGVLSESEWLEGLDNCEKLKAALETDTDPETGKLKCLITSGKAAFDMLRRQEGLYAVDNIEVARYLTALNSVFKPDEPAVTDTTEKLKSAPKEKMDPNQWLELLGTMPKLDALLKADYDSNRVRFNSFRSCGQQMSKLLGNLDRLRWQAARGEDVAEELETRKNQVRKFRDNGILPSPALSVFVQIDIDKSRTISASEFKRLIYGLKKVYPVEDGDVDDMLSKLDSDNAGEISEVQWCRNLASLPALKAALQKDLDPETGRLRSYRSVEDQLAKLLGNIARLEYDLAKDPPDEGFDVEAAKAELQSRKEQAQKCRDKGILPSAGVVVFNQIDKKKERKISKETLTELLTAVKVDGKTVDEIMTKLDVDEDGSISEKEWLEGLHRVQDLKLALEADIDPDTGKLKSYNP
eukprot:SAG31_NODE_6168_length_2140_cov_1.423322_1_plen_460_part_00